MNAQAKALQQNLNLDVFSNLMTLIKHYWLTVLLMLAILISALSVIYTKDLLRRLYSQQQSLAVQKLHYQTTWGKLLLEESTLAAQARVQSIAQGQLGMIWPNQQAIILLRQ